MPEPGGLAVAAQTGAVGATVLGRHRFLERPSSERAVLNRPNRPNRINAPAANQPTTGRVTSTDRANSHQASL